jgi:hypothetical protein
MLNSLADHMNDVLPIPPNASSSPPRGQKWSFLLGILLGWLTWYARESYAAAVGIEGSGDALFVLLLACSGAVATIINPGEFWPGPFGVAVGVALYAYLAPGVQASPFIGVVIGGSFLLSLLPAVVVHVIYRIIKEHLIVPRHPGDEG